MNNWFHISSRNISVNLDHIACINWEQEPESYETERAMGFKNVTRLVYIFDDNDWISISDFNDRIKLRTILVGDDWQPPEE